MGGVHTEKHYKVPELAKLWSLSDDLVRDLFEDEPGVLTITRPENVRKKKRAYVSLRIPASVAKRVLARKFSLAKNVYL
jgi:hypothetical protein